MSKTKYTKNGHANNVLGKIRNYFEDGKYCDVTLIAGKDPNKSRFPAHRAVLSACSEYFDQIFTNDPSIVEKELKIERQVLKDLMEYCYAGEISIGRSAFLLMLAAHEYSMLDLFEACTDFAIGDLKESNCIASMLFAEDNDFEKLQVSARENVRKHFKNVSASEKFLELNTKQVCDIIGSEEFQKSNVEDVCNSIVSWVQRDSLTRQNEALSLLKTMGKDLLTRSFILDNAIKLCGDNDECFAYIKKSM